VARRQLDIRDLGHASRVLLIIERAWLMRRLERAPPIVARLYALAAVMTGWVWFRARDFDHALTFFASLAGAHGWAELNMSTHSVLHPAIIAAMAIGIVLATVRINVSRAFQLVTARITKLAYAVADTIAIALFLALAVLSVAAGSYSPFLYFRF
jgi:alginate O-acetyltransferase complex protein AlgI